MIWAGVRCGHDPRVVGWHWPLHQLLGFIHAEMRRNGLRTYKPHAWQPVALDAKPPPVEFEDPWPR